LALAVALATVVASAEAAAAPPEISEPQGWDYVIPVGSLLAVNLTFWAVARYGLGADYSYIGADSVAANFDVGFTWDADAFPTNQIGHPYQGVLYHAGARSLGFGFWGSVPYTVLGSLQWELFMERQHPSYNDLITTSLGGVALGEVLFRLSSELIDESTRGASRAAREGGTLALSPVHGLARIFSGAATRDGAAPRDWPVRTRLAAGVDRMRPADLKRRGVPSLGLNARVIYGTIDESDESDEPFEAFDWFTLMVGLNFRDSQLRAAQLDITGLLARWSIDCDDDNACAVGAILHYDYLDSPIFKVGTSAIGAAFLAHFELPWSMDLLTELDLGVVALGGFDSPYAAGVGRDYNLGTGGMARSIISLSKRDWVRLRLIHTRYYVRTVHGADGHEFAGISRAEVEVPIYGGFAVSVASILYDRVGIPDDYPRLQRTYLAGQTHLVWTF
jgi:hypothetical protein